MHLLNKSKGHTGTYLLNQCHVRHMCGPSVQGPCTKKTPVKHFPILWIVHGGVVVSVQWMSNLKVGGSTWTSQQLDNKLPSRRWIKEVFWCALLEHKLLIGSLKQGVKAAKQSCLALSLCQQQTA